MSTLQLVDEEETRCGETREREEDKTIEQERVSNTRPRRFRSTVLQHYKKQKINGEDKAICNYCNSKLVGRATDGTRHLHDHLKTCPKRKQKDIKQYLLKGVKTSDEKSTLDVYAYDPDVTKREIASMIILHEYPISAVEHEGFRRVCKSLNPLFKPMSRNTIRNEIFQIYELEKAKIISLVSNNKSRIAITTDIWTASNQMSLRRGYMAVTAHFIDDSWTLQSRILRFIYVPCPHTAEKLCEVLFRCLMDLNIDRKLSTLTVDNCSTNDLMVTYLLEKLSSKDLILNGQLFHMRCCAHILNLIMKDGLDVIAEGIERIRDSVAYWTATQKRVEKFVDTAKILNISINRKLSLDCKTRWNSTYLMLASATPYRNVFTRLKLRDPQYKILPTEKDWELAIILEENLKMFYEVTEMFSGSKYPTTNLFFIHVCEIRLSLSKWLTSSYVEIKRMASSMILKFEKYWKMIHGVMAIATMLDPRYKMKLVEFYFPKIFGDDASFHTERVQKLCLDLVNEYELKRKSNAETSQYGDSSVSFISSRSPLTYSARKAARMMNFELFANSSNSGISKTEYNTYLDEPVLPMSNDFDILSWWRTNGCKYPILAEVARDILAIPVSTVASESAFSTGKRFFTTRRSCLHPRTVETLMCSNSWLWADLRGSSSTNAFGCHTSFDEDKDVDDDINNSLCDNEHDEDYGDF